jgi:hypothetical protein
MIDDMLNYRLALSLERQDSMTAMVSPVKPAELKGLWRIVNLFQTVRPSGSLASATLERACRAGADAEAIWFRATMLSMMPGMLAPWTHNDELDEAVFQIAATFPMRKVNIDVAQKGPPFDVKEFLKAIEAAAIGSTPAPS